MARQVFGFNDQVDKVINDAIGALKHLGAELIDPADIPTYSQFGEPEGEALLWEFKADLNAYLKTRGAAMRSLKDIIDFNERNRASEMPYFGQDQMLKAETKGDTNSKAYTDLVARLNRIARQDGIDAILSKRKLDALVAPTDGPAWLTDYVRWRPFHRRLLDACGRCWVPAHHRASGSGLWPACRIVVLRSGAQRGEADPLRVRV